MKTTRSLLVVLALLGASCTPQLTSIYFSGVYPGGDSALTCFPDAKPSVLQYAGEMNLAAHDSFFIVFGLNSLFESTVLEPHGNIAVMNELVLTYATAAGPIGTPVALPATDSLAITFSINPKSSDVLLLADLFGPAAKEALKAVPVTPRNEYFTIKVTAQLKGTLLSGGSANSNTVTFPIKVYRGNEPACTGGKIVDQVGTCGNAGQDGSPVVCCTPGMDCTI